MPRCATRRLVEIVQRKAPLGHRSTVRRALNSMVFYGLAGGVLGSGDNEGGLYNYWG